MRRSTRATRPIPHPRRCPLRLEDAEVRWLLVGLWEEPKRLVIGWSLLDHLLGGRQALELTSSYGEEGGELLDIVGREAPPRGVMHADPG